MPRPAILVLAGVNGAGKSSIGGYLLEQAGLTWFNPDRFARELMAVTGLDQDSANAQAWAESLRRLNDAIAQRHDHAFETTLGGTTMAARIVTATATHDVLVWFCGLDSPELHIARVKLRVSNGGHDIPEEMIRARYPRALRNVIDLMPHLTHLKVYDNSVQAAPGHVVPDPALVLETRGRQLVWPRAVQDLQETPKWAKPLVEAALQGPR